MSRRTIFYIVCGVIALHLVAFALLNSLDTRPKFKKITPPPKPNFRHYERVEMDASSGEKTIYRDIEVSTRLTPRESIPRDGRDRPTSRE